MAAQDAASSSTASEKEAKYSRWPLKRKIAAPSATLTADPKAGAVAGGADQVALEVDKDVPPKEPAPEAVGLFQLFQYATRGESVIMILGLVAAGESASLLSFVIC